MSMTLDRAIAEAILGIDTLWGGDVMNPSGTGRFIADAWFSDEELPVSYTHDTAQAVREAGGLSAGSPDRTVIDAYLQTVDLPEAIAAMRALGSAEPAPRGPFLEGLVTCLEVMWDLGMELLGSGDPVGYERSVEASTAAAPTPSQPAPRRERLAELLNGAGYPADNEDDMLTAVDAWRRNRMVPVATIPALARAFIAELEAGTVRHVLPSLPANMHAVPRANVRLITLEDAWFSGSMNYVGRVRNARGEPEYEATYEINGSLEISVPEYLCLISHEVLPGHVMTFALMQHLFLTGGVGFEGTILTMNSRYSTLAEGIANNAILMAHGVTEVEDLPDEDLQIGTLLMLLQDDAKNHASYLTWNEQLPQEEVAAVLRRDFLVSQERADKLSGPWARHPLLGRMYLPSYRAGTELVAELRRRHSSEVILPALFGCHGLTDVATIHDLIR